MKHGVTQGSILCPLFFLLYINDLSKLMSDKSNLLWFANDASIITTNSNLLAFRNNLKEVFMEEVEFIITCRQLSRIYQVIGNVLKHLEIDIFWLIPSITWRNTLIKTCHDLGSFHFVVNMKFMEL